MVQSLSLMSNGCFVNLTEINKLSWLLLLNLCFRYIHVPLWLVKLLSLWNGALVSHRFFLNSYRFVLVLDNSLTQCTEQVVWFRSLNCWGLDKLRRLYNLLNWLLVNLLLLRLLLFSLLLRLLLFSLFLNLLWYRLRSLGRFLCFSWFSLRNLHWSGCVSCVFRCYLYLIFFRGLFDSLLSEICLSFSKKFFSLALGCNRLIRLTVGSHL